MAKRNLVGKRILVTGCSSGIGRELCLKLCERGAIVLGTARRLDRLIILQDEIVTKYSNSRDISAKSIESDAAPGTTEIFEVVTPFSFLAGDICDQEFRAELADWVEEHWGGLDILINNAGVGGIGLFEDATEDRLRAIMDVDFFAAVELTRKFLPHLERGNQPAILNIGSVLSHRAVPLKSEYCAAKFALRGWSEALRVELMPKRIDVLMLSPSTTRSEFFDSLVGTEPGQKSASVGSMTPSKVAEAAVTVLVRSKRDMVLSFGGKFLVWAARIVPRFTDRILFKFGMPSKTTS